MRFGTVVWAHMVSGAVWFYLERGAVGDSTLVGVVVAAERVGTSLKVAQAGRRVQCRETHDAVDAANK